MTEQAKDQIVTMSDLMSKVQEIHQKMLEGSISEPKARLSVGFLKLLLKGADLNLQYKRLERGKQPEKELLVLNPKEEDPKMTRRSDDIRPGSLGSRCRQVARSVELLHLHRLSGS